MSENYSKGGEENRIELTFLLFLDISIETSSVYVHVATWRGMSENYSERGEEIRI